MNFPVANLLQADNIGQVEDYIARCQQHHNKNGGEYDHASVCAKKIDWKKECTLPEAFEKEIEDAEETILKSLNEEERVSTTTPVFFLTRALGVVVVLQ